MTDDGEHHQESNHEEYKLKIRMALNKLEEASMDYRCSDYLKLVPQSIFDEQCHRPAQLNDAWRERVCEFFYRIADQSTFNFSRDVVIIAVSILDRFLAKKLATTDNLNKSDLCQNKNFYEVASLTAFYLGVNVFYGRKRNRNYVHTVGCTSDDVFCKNSLLKITSGIELEHIERMEEEIVTTLSHLLCPPTPLLFVRFFLALFPANSALHRAMKNEILENAGFLCELSVCDYFFVGCRPSTLAYASILNAMEMLEASELVPHVAFAQSAFLRNVSCIANLSPDIHDIIVLQSRLREIFTKSAESQQRRQDPGVGNQLDRSPRTCIPRVVSVECIRNKHMDETTRIFSG